MSKTQDASEALMNKGQGSGLCFPTLRFPPQHTKTARAGDPGFAKDGAPIFLAITVKAGPSKADPSLRSG